MKKQSYRMIVTLPAHRDQEKFLDELLDRGYNLLGTKLVSFAPGEVSRFWELGIVEHLYTDEKGDVVGYWKEGLIVHLPVAKAKRR